MRQFGLFVSVGGAMSGISWLIKPSNHSDVTLTWIIRFASVVCFLTPIGVSIWLSRLADPVPDFLAGISTRFFERDGLSFLITVEKAADYARMVVYYQNRFDKPCIATIAVGPTRKAFTDLDGLPIFEFNLSVEGAEFGKQSVAWSIPLRFQGKKILWDVAAQVKFPAGRGVLLRGRNGAAVGDHLVGGGEEAVKAVTSLVLSAAHLHSMPARAARVELTLPANILPDRKQPSNLTTETIWKLGDPIG
ncbi:MAG: hypothetical protein DME24_22960 [Verrucomicrobia bacterium]|nr:MAG: hypothetical protein DME24_22960 [Verrucomicrobiota bacterium]